ncbi:MAG TPA: hypothetical protein VFM48_00010 [Aquabacterium sp.]|nr:hypothetical protein [Aquabacterium sp.]
MSKDSGGFLKKVVRFVANPTTDWTELDAPASEVDRESEYAKSEIKAMIERKRRNDFVRKRELDMLRKIRREGLNQDNALLLGTASKLDPDSRPQSGARSDIAVKAKIDEIEMQMVGDPAARLMRPPAAVVSGHGRLTDLKQSHPTVSPVAPTQPSVLPFSPDSVPRMTQSVGEPLDLDLAGQSVAPAPIQPAASQAQANEALSRPPLSMHVQEALDVAEVVHDPELDEAVIAFANADFDLCERCLLDLVNPGGARHDQTETWMVLFDFYRSLDLPEQFDNLAVSFVHKFGLSAPQWYSLPKRVSDYLAAKAQAAPAPEPEAPAAPSVETQEDEGQTVKTLEGWIAPRLLDSEAISQLRVEALQMPKPWTMDWSDVVRVTPEGAAGLSQLMQQWAKEKTDINWIGVENLLNILADTAPSGVKDADPACWMLRLDILRLCNRPTQFDEVAIDYCITYELSPPSWEPAQARVRLLDDSVSPLSRPLSHVSEISTSFVESQMHNEVEFVQVASLDLSGQLIGDIGGILTELDSQLGESVSLDIDCTYLLRVDFIAAGDLLNWVLARRSEGRAVNFLNPHRLVALFFGAMGINEHARVKLQLV